MLQRYMKPFSMLVILVVFSGLPASAETRFEAWVQAFKTEARSQGIDAALLDRVFQGMTPLPKVLQLDRHQPESTITFAQYRTRTVTRERIRKGRALLAQHRTLLQTISQQYGVPPRFLVALWGVETDYGRYTGEFHVWWKRWPRWPMTGGAVRTFARNCWMRWPFSRMAQSPFR